MSPDVAAIRPAVQAISDIDESQLDTTMDAASTPVVLGPTPPARITRISLILAGHTTAYQPRRLSYLCNDAWTEYLQTRRIHNLQLLVLETLSEDTEVNEYFHDLTGEDLSRFLDSSKTVMDNMGNIQPHQGSSLENETEGERFR